jgi:LuxR family maltose regulon positive regulatory protein
LYSSYSLHVECDSDIFEKTYKEFKNNKNKELAKKLLSLYKGEYLADFEALWSAATRIEARDYCLK